MYLCEKTIEECLIVVEFPYSAELLKCYGKKLRNI